MDAAASVALTAATFITIAGTLGIPGYIVARYRLSKQSCPKCKSKLKFTNGQYGSTRIETCTKCDWKNG